MLAEIARQAAQMKLMRKLEKQALARAAKEARKQQGKFSLCRELKRKGLWGSWGRGAVHQRPRIVAGQVITSTHH